MKRTVLTALAVLMTVAAPAAFAQPDRDHDRRDDYRHDERSEYRHHDEWRKGYHMNHADWDRGRRIDWRERHLSRPPHGYEWREVDGNYVMAAVATGIIASVIANAH
jgi:Ni/Co efflux regulator RcnB